MAARRTLLLLDGLDEGGTIRGDVERHIADVLAPQGHVVLATSRPAGLQEELFADFHRLRLAPVTDTQQEEVIRCDTLHCTRLICTVHALSSIAFVCRLRCCVLAAQNVPKVC